MKRSISLMFVLIGIVGCLMLAGCQSTGMVNADGTAFTAPPEAVITGNTLLIKLHDAGKNFMAVERPKVNFKKETIVLTTGGFVQSAGGTRIFRCELPRRFHKIDMKDKILWTNIDGSTTPMAVENRNIKSK